MWQLWKTTSVTQLSSTHCYLINIAYNLKDTTMKKRTRSILQELSSLNRSDSDLFIENTGINLIESAINLLNEINYKYGEEVASDLERKFLNSIKSGDSRKFKRGMHRIIENKQ